MKEETSREIKRYIYIYIIYIYTHTKLNENSAYQNIWDAVKIEQDHRSIIEASTLRTALLNFQMYEIF